MNHKEEMRRREEEERKKGEEAEWEAANRPVGTLASQGLGETGAASSSWETSNVVPERDKDDDDGDPFGFGQLGFDDDDR